MLISNASRRIEEIQRRPIFIGEGAPYDIVAVDRDRIVDPHVFHGPANVIDVFFKFELWRVDADQHQSLNMVFIPLGADIGKRAPPVYAGVGPEIDEDDLSAQRRRCQGRRIDPAVRALERIQF